MCPRSRACYVDHLVASPVERVAQGFHQGSLINGSMVDPGKSYLLEFKTNGLALAEDLLKLLKSVFKFSARVRKRGKHYIVYMKRFLDIRDLLAIMGATESLIKMEDVSMKKDLMNNANRLKNCDSANIDKTIAAH